MPVDRVSLYRGLGSGIADVTDTILSEIEKKKLLKKQQEDFLNFALQQIIRPGKQSTVGMLQNQNPVNPLNQVKLPGLPEDIQGAERRNILSKANLQEMPIAGMASRSSGFPLTTTMLPKTEKVFNPNNPELLRNTELLKNPYVMQALGLAKAQTELNKEKLYNIGEGTDVRDVNTGNLWARNQKEFAPVMPKNDTTLTEIELRNEYETTQDPKRKLQIGNLLNRLQKNKIDIAREAAGARGEETRKTIDYAKQFKTSTEIRTDTDETGKQVKTLYILDYKGDPISKIPFGTTVDQTQITKFNDKLSATQATKENLEAYFDKLEPLISGRIVGGFNELVASPLGFSPEVKSILDERDLLLGGISRDVGQQRGVLTDRDLSLIKPIMGRPANTIEEFNNNKKAILDIIDRAIQREANKLNKAGVSNPVGGTNTKTQKKDSKSNDSAEQFIKDFGG